METRKDFASKLGMVLATAGSAVGLGNIWRFPVEAGARGGATFIIIYILCVIALGIPLIVAEFAVGRAAHTNTSAAYEKLTTSRFWRQTGRLGVLTGWIIMCYYVVVSGWTLAYLVKALMSPPIGAADAVAKGGAYWSDFFDSFISGVWLPTICVVVFMLLSHFVIVRGVQSGIEKFSKLMMPMLFVILIVLCVSSFFMSGAREGLSFLFRPDFSQLSFSTVLAALGQSFFSLSLGMGCLCTYASYFSRTTNLTRTATQVAGIDSLVAIMAGIIIFPAVFSAGIQPDAGPSLVFVALPGVFEEVFGAWPWVAYIVSILFYFLLVLATLTSLISLHEVPTAYLSEDFHLSRKKATTIVTLSVVVVGALCSMSWGPLADVKLFGLCIFDLFDWVSSHILLVVSGGLIACFVGWKMDRATLQTELTSDGQIPLRRVRWITFLLRWFAPIVILLIFLSGIGVI